MISRDEVQTIAKTWNLDEVIIERDYALGWMLWGIGNTPDLAETWVFKGGTCIKKCYANTHRYSEDLDFTILPTGPFRPEDLTSVFEGVRRKVTEQSGINFLVADPKFELRPDGYSTEGRLYFVGPRGTPVPISIKLDLSASEKMVRLPVLKTIMHPYSDELPKPDQVRAYNLEEVFGEKVRAMGERSRPRDLYDIVYLARRSDLNIEASLLRQVLAEKCAVKNVEVPTFEKITSDEIKADCAASWPHMLGHQLGALPDFEGHWETLEDFFLWLEGNGEDFGLEGIAIPEEEKWTPPTTEWQRGDGEKLEPIRFAAVNRLLLSMGYKGGKREVESYSLRRSLQGAILFFARAPNDIVKAYRLDRIESLQVISKPYKPIWPVEFSQKGRFSAPLVRRQRSTYRKKGDAGGFSYRYEKIYKVECPYCGKIFIRKTADLKIKKHLALDSHIECLKKSGTGYRVYD